MPPATSRATIGALLGLTFATGIIDAASVLGPGRVFTANMTGNVVFLGFALAGRGATSLESGLVALVSFAAGALLGGRVVSGAGPSFLRWGLAVEIGAVAMATAVAATRADSPLAVHAVVALLALAMGLRNVIVRKLGVQDMTTTVLTLTVAGLVGDSSWAGGTHPHAGRRVLSVVAMFLGAWLGAWALRFGWWAALAAALVVECASALSLGRTMSQ